MLLFRSISQEVFLLLLINQLYAEEYNYDDSGDHSEYSEGDEHGHPDYSKYFSVDGPSAAQVAPGAGFGISEFSGFFSPQPVEYAGSNKKENKILTVPPIHFVPQAQQTQTLPLFSPVQQATNLHLSPHLRDFFEESQKSLPLVQHNQPNENFVKPGPSYISHSLPLHGNFGEVKSASADEVERIPPRPNKPKEKDEEEEIDDSDKEINGDDEDVESKVNNDKYGLELLKNSKPYVDYTTGKSSSTVSQYPLAKGLIGSPSKLTPYQKYSFQPIVQASRILSDDYDSKPVRAFNPNYQKKNEPLIGIEGQATENIPSHLKNHDCRKLDSSTEGANCFVCTNAETNSKYTQCSYTAEKEPVEYYAGASERYSVPAKHGHFRYKRRANRKVDPYYLIRERSRKSFEEPSIPDDYSSGFKYEPESYEESPSELSYSEQQSEEIQKNPQNCKKVEKDGSTCTICRNPKTGGNFEQCSYTSAPQEKKYAYVKEKKYDSDDEPEESKIKLDKKPLPASTTADLKVETTEPKPETKPASKDFEPVEDYQGQIKQDNKNLQKRNNDEDPIDYENYEKNKKNSEKNFLKEKYDIPYHFAESVLEESKDKNEKNDDSSENFDEYHFKLFPELSKEESKQEEHEDANEEYVIPESTKHNVEEVLAEFSKKDRSNCKKSEKNGMTCFLCVDKNNIQHEECMFVQESRPVSSHVAYHQLKGIKKLANEDPKETEETKNRPVIAEVAKEEEEAKDALKGASEVSSLLAAASQAYEEKVPYKQEQNKKKKRTKKYKKKSEEPEPTLKTPTEFEVGSEEGAFSAETRPVHSKVHGVTLPKYMLEKSEFEKEFDAFSGAL